MLIVNDLGLFYFTEDDAINQIIRICVGKAFLVKFSDLCRLRRTMRFILTKSRSSTPALRLTQSRPVVEITAVNDGSAEFLPFILVYHYNDAIHCWEFKGVTVIGTAMSYSTIGIPDSETLLHEDLKI